MVLKSVKEVSANRRKLEIEVEPFEFEEGVEQAYRKIGKKYNVPGFRKGKVPRNFIERRYGKGVFFEEAVNILCPKILDKAIKEASLDVIEDKMDFDLKDINEAGFVFSVTLTIRPVINVSGYRGIKVKPFTKTVTQEMLEERIHEIREKHSKLVTVNNRACDLGDTVVLDFVGKINGKPFRGSTAKNYSLKLGSKNTIEGFESGIIGHGSGDVFDLSVSFPEWYGNKKVSGKEAVFTITLHEIKEPVLPEVTDDFVKEIGQGDTVQDFKDKVLKVLEFELMEEKEEDFNMQIINKAVKLVVDEIPEAMFVQRDNENLKNLRSDYLAHRISSEDVIYYTSVSPGTNKSRCRELAEQQVELALVLEAVARQESLVPTEEMIGEEYKKLAKLYKTTEEKVMERIKRGMLIHDLSCLMAFDFLKKNAVVEVE